MASGTTPVKGRPYPLETDTPDVAADMQALAVSLDTAPNSTKGTLAGLPVSGQSRGDLYQVVGDAAATNNGLLYGHTGAAWQLLNGFRLVARTAVVNTTAAYGALYVCLAGVTLTLPAPQSGQIIGVSASSGFVSGANPVTVARSSGTISGVGLNGVTSFTLGTLGASVILWSDGVQWFVIGGEVDTGWQSLIIQSGWTATPGYHVPAARLLGDVVSLRGSLSLVTTGANAAQLPSSAIYPSVIVAWGNDTSLQPGLTPAGMITSDGLGAISLDGLTYSL